MSKQMKARSGWMDGSVSIVGRSLVAAAVLAVVSVSSAAAQDSGALVQRLQRLERDVQTLQRQVYRGDGGSGAALPSGAVPRTASKDVPVDVAGRMQVRLAELERLIQELTGRVEQAQFGVDGLEKRLNDLQSDIDFRLSRIEQTVGLSAVSGGSEEPSAADDAVPPRQTQDGVLGYLPGDAGAAAGTGQTAPDAEGGGQAVAALPEGTPDQQYAYAFGLLRRGDFGKAEAALQAFLEQNPDHELAGNAQYWLGETYYVRGDYKRAAVAFLDGYKTFPNSSKGPDNLLKLGMTMGALGQTENACAALGRLAQEYPGASDVIIRRAAAERDRLECK